MFLDRSKFRIKERKTRVNIKGHTARISYDEVFKESILKSLEGSTPALSDCRQCC